MADGEAGGRRVGSARLHPATAGLVQERRTDDVRVEGRTGPHRSCGVSHRPRARRRQASGPRGRARVRAGRELPLLGIAARGQLSGRDPRHRQEAPRRDGAGGAVLFTLWVDDEVVARAGVARAGHRRRRPAASRLVEPAAASPPARRGPGAAGARARAPSDDLLPRSHDVQALHRRPCLRRDHGSLQCRAPRRRAGRLSLPPRAGSAGRGGLHGDPLGRADRSCARTAWRAGAQRNRLLSIRAHLASSGPHGSPGSATR
jgi:hypothetical protein